MAETKRERLAKIHLDGKQERDNAVTPDWKDLADYVLPSRGRFLVEDQGRRPPRRNKIIDSSATLAARTQSAGMFTGITSPARPWFRLQTPDPDMMENAAVKEWLHIVEERMRNVMLRSNLYNALPVLFGDLGTFGTGAFLMLEDARTTFRCFSLPLGSFTLAQNDSLRVDTLTREYRMTVRQLVEAFGLAKVSPTVRSLWDTSKYNELVSVTHVIGPNYWQQQGRRDASNMPVASCYWETSDGGQTFLRESGFSAFPAMAPRWDLTGADVYASDCPGMTCLGDVKALQLLHKQKAKANEKKISPPLVAPSSLKQHKISQLPADVTFVDTMEGQSSVRALYDVRFDTQPVLEDIREHQQRISRAYYEDLFIMLAQSDRRDITAREVEERHEEKLLMLGPVLERLNSELLDPLIDRVFGLMLNAGMLPQPPEELQEMDLRVEYISIMAQAQKILSAGAIERFSGFVGSLAAGNPEVLDKYDMDQSIDEYGAITGVPPRLIRSDDQVAEIRAQRQAAQQQASQVAMAGQAVQGAKVLSETDTSRDNALTRILGGGGPATG